VRERLTELGVDYLVRQVPVERSERTALLHATGAETIPTLVTGDAHSVVGEDAILAYLDDHVVEPPEADALRVKAATARRRYLEKECECPEPATP
jgi:glutathione S-transferase